MGPWQFSVYLVPLLVSVLASVLLSGVVWRYREYQYARSLILLLAAVTWWSLTYVVGLATTDPAVKRVAYSLAYPAVGLVSVAWFVFAVQYTGRLRVPTKRELGGLGIVPVLTAVAALTDQYHGLVWSSVDIVSREGLELMITSPGILFWLHTLQSYALIGLGTACLFATTVVSDRTYSSAGVTLMLAAGIPAGVNILYLTGFVAPIDLTPAAFALSGTVLIGAAFRDQFLQSLPLAREVARDELIKQMASPVIVVDTRARVVDTNPAAESLTDVTADAIGSHFDTAFPEIADAVDLRDESPHRTHITKTDTETERHYELEKLPLHRGVGRIRGHLLRMNDVTELRDRQRELVEERQFIDQALDALDDLFYVLDVDGYLRQWNEQFIDVTGYSESELDEMHAVELFPDDDRELVTDAVETTLRDGETTVEADLLTADGEVLSHEFTGARLEDEDGRPTGLVGVGRDISDRKERERRLRTFREAVENAGRMIYWMDSDGTVEYVNPAVETQTKEDASELVGRQTPPLARQAQSETLVDEMMDTLAGGETWRAEFTVRRSDGERRTFDQTVQPVYDSGELERFVAVAGDVTERKRRKQQLSVLQRILRHDLRNNLNEILLSVQLAGRKATNDAVRQQLDGAEQTIAETLSLSRDVRQFKQAFESGGIDNSVVDIAETTREQLATIRTERTNVDFSVDLSGAARVVTNDLVGRAVRNVIRNAIEHNDSDSPRVAVTLDRRHDTDELELRVADNGPGIPDETIDVLNSEQEAQLDHLDGFGLWLVHWVLTLSGGSLEFAENTPRGTVVTLVLPAAETTDHRRVQH
jgi:PAS domain S-box-containing protein